MLCPSCGNQVNDSFNNCNHCGAALKTAPTANYQQPNYQQPVYQQPVYHQPVYQQPNYQQPNYQQPNYQQPVYQQPKQKPFNPGKKLGITSFLYSFITIFLFIISSFLMFASMEVSKTFAVIGALPGIILGIVGLIKSKKANMKNGFAIAGIIINTIYFMPSFLHLILLLVD